MSLNGIFSCRGPIMRALGIIKINLIGIGNSYPPSIGSLGCGWQYPAHRSILHILMEFVLPYRDLADITFCIKGHFSSLYADRMEAPLEAQSLDKWIDGLQASGTYAFVRSQAISASGRSAEAVKKALQRLIARKRIAKVKDYFFVIVPLEYLSAGSPPVSWFIHDLMKTMGLPYYVGLLSAAAQHGASHHQPLEFQVMTDRSVRPLRVGRTRIRFFASKYVSRAATMDMKTPTGSMRVSTPETTVVDLVRFAKAAGHLDHVATIIRDLSPLLDPKRLVAAIRMVDDIPNTQRLGYLFDHARQRRLAEPIHAWLERRPSHALPLRSGRPLTETRLNHRWNILVNQPLEVEA